MLRHTSLFIFSLCRYVTFYKALTSLSTVFIKCHVGILQLLKWPCRTSFFIHVEHYLYSFESSYSQPLTLKGNPGFDYTTCMYSVIWMAPSHLLFSVSMTLN